MIKLALVFLIFNLDYINTKPVLEISEKYSDDGTTVLNNDTIISKVKSKVESAMKNLVNKKARSLDPKFDSNSDLNSDLASELRISLDQFEDIRKAVTEIDLPSITVQNQICTTVIPKFPVAPLHSLLALVCYS